MTVLNLSAPWWDQTVNEGVGIAGAIFFTSGDISHAVDDYMYCVIFNKEMYNTTITDGTDVYELVRNGTWTLDAMTKILLPGQRGPQRRRTRWTQTTLRAYDLVRPRCLRPYRRAGERLAKVNEDGLIEYTLQTSGSTNIVYAFLKDRTRARVCINFQTMTGGVSWPNVFSNNQAMFLMSLFNEVSRFRDMEGQTTAYPQPRVMRKSGTLVLHASAPDLQTSPVCPDIRKDAERTGAILDLLGYYSEDTTSPAYYQRLWWEKRPATTRAYSALI